jgi:small subunit ribosomal protein S21|tara:strand:+ start:2221 stop:2421 length:201 start_codon:yes stop_codon:yes gene_type:complete
MLNINIVVGKNESIDRALKRFKRKFRNLKLLQKLRDKQQYTKPSTKKREKKQKSIYNKIKKDSYDE